MTCGTCKQLLSEGLDLCVRARLMDSADTFPLWLEEQYQADLAAWEAKSRHHLMQGCGKINDQN